MSVAPPAPIGRTEKLSRLRRIIATRMVESLQISAQLTTVVEVDFVHVAELRRGVKERVLEEHGVKLSYLPFIAKAALDALSRHPVVNASVDMERGEVTYYETRNLALAVDTERGLVAPVIPFEEATTVTRLALDIAAIADQARAGKLMPDQLSGGTFTITNTGSRGALFDTPIVNQPQVAILGTGAIVERPVVVAAPGNGSTGHDSRIEIRPVGYLALSYDHRLVDGADAARYLSDVKQSLESADWASSVL